MVKSYRFKKNPFCSTFDGHKHTISNLQVDAFSTAQNMGFYGVADNATVKNFNINIATYSVYEMHRTVGSICAESTDTEIINCISNPMIIEC